MIHAATTALVTLLVGAALLVSWETPGTAPLPLPSALAPGAYEPRLFDFLEERRYVTLGWVRDVGVRDTGPFVDGMYYGTHPAVRVFYSPEVHAWLRAGRPDTPIPDGAMIVKEMYAPPAARYDGLDREEVGGLLFAWTVMVKDGAGSRDGWFWAYHEPRSEAPAPDAHPFRYPDAGFGLYCVRCHASAEKEFTFASLRNIEGEPGEPVRYFVDDSWREPARNDTDPPTPHTEPAADAEAAREDGAGREADPAFLATFDAIARVAPEDVVALPPATLDHVVAPATPPGGPEHFLTSDQCMSCHDGQGDPFGPNMLLPPDADHGGADRGGEDDGTIDVSPFGEWRWSMMGLAGRDPIFYAQLESETSLHAERSEEIQDLCLGCHGVMGQRQWRSDGHEEPFTLDRLLSADPADPERVYGALARDGVSCMVCHQIVDEGGTLDGIATGRFRVSAPDEDGNAAIHGPFADPAGWSMESSLGLIPQQSDYIGDSRLCASCHTVHLPVLDGDGEPVGSDFEQATYLEWLNSDFRNAGPDPRSCQDCHMTDELHGAELAFRIANIQDQTYPEADHLAPLDEIKVPIRGAGPDEAFRRHTLLGINQFGLELFRQFGGILGVLPTNYMTGSDDGLPFAIEESDRLAKEETARVEILDAELAGSTLTSRVQVTNLTGHRFPSGVGFRRAFLEFRVQDDDGEVIWASGRTNALGVILDEEGEPLPSEFHDPLDPDACRAGDGDCEQAYQPHHETIARQDQVQIYEELTRDPDGRFTTSFLSLMHEVKDNRLLPRGWMWEGPEGFSAAYSADPEVAEEALAATRPAGQALRDPDFLDGTGSDLVTYRAALPPGVLEGPGEGRSLSVVASLYYQAIPPFYLRQRFTTADGENTRRLHYLTSHLDTEGTNIEGWKLLIQSDRSVVSGN